MQLSGYGIGPRNQKKNCKMLVHSMPNRVKQVTKNNGGHKKQ